LLFLYWVTYCICYYWYLLLSCGMAQAASHWLLTEEAWVDALISPRGICDVQSGTGTDFSPSPLGFPCQYHSITQLSILMYHLEDEQKACWYTQFRDILSNHLHEQLCHYLRKINCICCIYYYILEMPSFCYTHNLQQNNIPYYYGNSLHNVEKSNKYLYVIHKIQV
jgi:hypothetical protein